MRHGSAGAACPRRSARAQLVVDARSKDLRKVRGSARYCQKPTVDLHDRNPNTQTRVIEIPIRIRLLSAFFIIGGAAHFAFSDRYVSIMPPWLLHPMALVLMSGGFEIAGGVGVLNASTRRVAGLGLVLLSLAVLPANVQMLLDAHAEGASTLWLSLLWLRLPLQLVLIYWIARATAIIGARATIPTAQSRRRSRRRFW